MEQRGEENKAGGNYLHHIRSVTQNLAQTRKGKKTAGKDL